MSSNLTLTVYLSKKHQNLLGIGGPRCHTPDSFQLTVSSVEDAEKLMKRITEGLRDLQPDFKDPFGWNVTQPTVKQGIVFLDKPDVSEATNG